MSRSPVAIHKKVFEGSDNEILSGALTYIEKELKTLNVKSKLSIRALLISEEMISDFIQNRTEGTPVQVRIRKWLGDTNITISSEGREYDPFDGSAGFDIGTIDDSEEVSQKTIRSILLKSVGSKLKYSHKRGINTANITVGQSERSMLYATIFALILGISFGLLLKFVMPLSVTDSIANYALTPAKTMFMNALKIIVGPVVFFSIVTCFSQFKNLSEIGKIGAKVMGTYMGTTVVATLLSFAIFFMIKPGKLGFALSMTGASETVAVDTSQDTSLVTMLVNIVPSNFVRPFLESDTLQLIFLAVICGIAVGMVGDYSKVIKDLFEAFNSLFLMITTIITRFIPVAVFAAMALIVIKLDSTSLMSLASFMGTFVLTIFCMMCFYGLLILAVGHLNPLRFFMNNREGMLTSFILCSSSAAMPVNLRVCTDRMGVAQRISNFSIPLGATVNMDGGSIFLTLSGLFLARAYGVEIPVSAMISLGITVILLSLSTPGVPGAGLVSVSVVLSTLGLPQEALSMIIGIYSFVDMFTTMNNTTGDVATTVLVAKSEKLLDTKVYYSKD